MCSICIGTKGVVIALWLGRDKPACKVYESFVDYIYIV